jgi:hypothetical protein
MISSSVPPNRLTKKERKKEKKMSFREREKVGDTEMTKF